MYFRVGGNFKQRYLDNLTHIHLPFNKMIIPILLSDLKPGRACTVLSSNLTAKTYIIYVFESMRHSGYFNDISLGLTSVSSKLFYNKLQYNKQITLEIDNKIHDTLWAQDW